MKVDTLSVPFTGVAEDGNIAVFVVKGVERWAIGVNVTNVTGTPTNFHFEVHPAETAVDGTEFKTTSDLRSPDLTAAGRTMLTLQGTTPVNPVRDNAFEFIHVHAHFSAGSAPTVSGTVFLWRTEK